MPSLYHLIKKVHLYPHRVPQTPSECLASGASGTWTEWRCLNRLRTKMGRCKHNQRKLKCTYEDDTTCDCKDADQTMEHLLECPLLRQTCSLDDLMVYNDVPKRMCQTMNRIGLATQQEEEVGSKMRVLSVHCLYEIITTVIRVTLFQTHSVCC